MSPPTSAGTIPTSCSRLKKAASSAAATAHIDTVLSFHHPSLIAEYAAAEKVVIADLSEDWVSAPARHLPFVPCRILPRGVIMQQRAKFSPSAHGEPTITPYMKPRITTDSSHGGDSAVNVGVESHERGTSLPVPRITPEASLSVIPPAITSSEQRRTSWTPSPLTDSAQFSTPTYGRSASSGTTATLPPAYASTATSASVEGGVGFFPESGGVFSHTHFCAFLCIRMHFCAFYCIFRALGRAAFYTSVTF